MLVSLGKMLVCACVFRFMVRSAALSDTSPFNAHLNATLIITPIITDILKHRERCGCEHVGAHSCPR